MPPSPGRRRLAAALAAGAFGVAGTAHALTPRTPPVDPARMPVLTGTIDRVLGSESTVVIQGVRYGYATNLPPVPGEPAGRVAWRAGTKLRFQTDLRDGRLQLISASEASR